MNHLADQFLEKARNTARLARHWLDSAADDPNVSENVAADAARAMFQAVHGMLISLAGEKVEPDALLSSFRDNVVKPGILPETALQMLIDASDIRTRLVYDVGAPIRAEEARRIVARADQFVALISSSISQRDRINRTAGVAGGDACVGSTRIPVWTLVELMNLGRTWEQLLQDFPSLSPQDLDAVSAYYRDRPQEIDEAIAAQERED